MVLVEDTAVAAGLLPIGGLREHLRLGTGFASDSLQDGLLEACLRASLAQIEGRTGQALLRRSFTWRIWSWATREGQPIPIAPVVLLTRLEEVAGDGTATEIGGERYGLGRLGGVPVLLGRGAGLPEVPVDGHLRLVFEAGLGDDWAGVPVDLRQAVMIQAARFYEDRGLGADAGRGGGLAPAALALIGPYLPARLGAARGLA